MIRVRTPGGVATSAQWLEMDRLANKYGNGTLKLTTRQDLPNARNFKMEYEKANSRN